MGLGESVLCTCADEDTQVHFSIEVTRIQEHTSMYSSDGPSTASVYDLGLEIVGFATGSAFTHTGSGLTLAGVTRGTKSRGQSGTSPFLLHAYARLEPFTAHLQQTPCGSKHSPAS